MNEQQSEFYFAREDPRKQYPKPLRSIESATGRAADEWLDWAEGVVRTVVGVKGLVTPDDLQDAMDADEMRPPNPGLVGVLWNRMRRLGLARHGEEPDLDVAQLLVEMAVGVDAHPNLPVMYASVRSCFGLVKRAWVSPSSTSRPRSKKAVTSEIRAACCKLCVTVTMV